MCVSKATGRRLIQLWKDKEETAYRSGDRTWYDKSRSTLTEELRTAKRLYTEKLKKTYYQLMIWGQCVRLAASHQLQNNSKHAYSLLRTGMAFYWRFEKPFNQPSTPTPQSSTPPTASTLPAPQSALIMCKEDVRQSQWQEGLWPQPGVCTLRLSGAAHPICTQIKKI